MNEMNKCMDLLKIRFELIIKVKKVYNPIVKKVSLFV